MSEEQENNSGDQMEAAAPETFNETQSQGSEHESTRQVPLDALQAERAERQKFQDELRMMKENMALMQASQQSQVQKKEEFEGLQDDDVLTVGEFKRALTKKERQYELSLKELHMTQRHPDYQQVVTKYLPEVLKQNPGLRNTLEQTQDYELAYYLAKNSESYKAENIKVKKNADAERIVQNANRAGSLSSVGQNSPISQAKHYKDMSSDDFKKLVNKNLGYK